MAKTVEPWAAPAGRTIDPTLVDAIRASAGTKWVRLGFYRKDGTLSERTFQFHAACRLVKNDKGDAQSARMADAGLIWGALPEKDDKGKYKSLSFKKDRVAYIRFDGQELKAR